MAKRVAAVQLAIHCINRVKDRPVNLSVRGLGCNNDIAICTIYVHCDAMILSPVYLAFGRYVAMLQYYFRRSFRIKLQDI